MTDRRAANHNALMSGRLLLLTDQFGGLPHENAAAVLAGPIVAAQTSEISWRIHIRFRGIDANVDCIAPFTRDYKIARALLVALLCNDTAVGDLVDSTSRIEPFSQVLARFPPYGLDVRVLIPGTGIIAIRGPECRCHDVELVDREPIPLARGVIA
jgi:hypothetical protein